MNQGSRLKRMILALLAQMLSRDSAQFRVHQGKQAVQSGFVATGVFVDQHRNGGVRCHELGISFFVHAAVMFVELTARWNVYAYDAYVLACAVRRAPLLTLDGGLKARARELK